MSADDDKENRSTAPRILRSAEVEDRTGLSSVTIWRLEKAHRFPRRRRLTGNLVGWRSDEIDAWVRSREPLPVLDEGKEAGSH